MRNILNILYLLLITLMLYSCANPASPSGGPSDEDPPILIKSKPALNQKNYLEEKIQLFFDEIVVLKDTRSNFIVSPPLEEDPEIIALAKKISIDLKNELQPNTTYTIYMGNSIVDNNEGNPIEDFTFSFSTGEVIDSMLLEGIVINAKDLEPKAGVIVGIYANLEDSAFTKHVPLRIAKTNSDGHFTIRNVAPGNYKIYALNEPVKNYRYDTGEELAFLDSVFIPYLDTIQVQDTIWIDSVTVDSIIFRDTLVYGPDDIVLQTFEKFRLTQNLRIKERNMPYQFLFSFSSEIQENPKMKILGTPSNYGAFFSEYSITRDSIYYWLTDSSIFNQDTLFVELEYQKTDSIEQLYWKKDTIRMIYREKKRNTRKRKKQDEEEKIVIPNLRITTNINQNMDLNGKIIFEFTEPIKKFIKEDVHLYHAEDTLKTPLSFKLEKDSINIRKFVLDYPWEGGKSYGLEIDSAAIENIYGISSNTYSSSFNVKALDQYGNLTFNIKKPNYQGTLSILNSKGEVAYKQDFNKHQTKLEFTLLKPGNYYFMLFFDTNENGVWDTGDYFKHIQAEPVRYLNHSIEIKAYRDYEQDWDTELIPLWNQKPKALIGLNEKKR